MPRQRISKYAKFLCAAALTALLPVAATQQASAGPVDVKAELGRSVISSKGGKIYLRLSLKAIRESTGENRTPINVALVLDRSGSMKGRRLEAAKEAAEMALSRLGRDDIVSLVAYNHAVNVLQPATRLTSDARLRSIISELTADGRTALYAGVVEGGRELEKFYSERRVNRVVLLSDGLANVGPSKPRELAELGRKLGSKGISVSTIGLGLGYNEDLMQRLALASDGNHAFAERPGDLVGIFNSEFGDALTIAAQDVEVIIECEVGFKPVRVLGRTADISGSKVKLKLNQLQASNERYVVIELEADAGMTTGNAQIARVDVDYLDIDKGKRKSTSTQVNARISSSDSEIENSLNKPVMSQVAAQVATEASEKAVDLRDKGDIAGARKVLQENAAYLNRSRKQFGTGLSAAPAASVKALDDLEKKSLKAAKNLDARNWAKTRKSMRYDQHKAKSQQQY